MTKLSDTALILLSKAAQRDDRFAELPKNLPAAARNAVARSLLEQGLLIEDAVALKHPMAWRTDDAGADGDNADGALRCSIALRITDAGFRAINLDPPEAEAEFEPAGTVATTAPSAEELATEAQAVADALDAAPLAPTPRVTLRDTAAAVLAAWDNEANRETDIIAAPEDPMATLRTLLAAKAPRETAAPRKPREGTKQEAVLTMLRRTEGATVAQIAEATGWATHTVRGFLAGLNKKGFTISTLERVRMVGPNKEGAKGSYTIYQLAS